MANDTKGREELKTYFLRNSIPTEENFKALIDGMLNQKDDGIFKSGDGPLSIKAYGDNQKTIFNFSDDGDTGPTWTLSLNAPDDANKRGFNVSCKGQKSGLFIDENTGRIGIGNANPSVMLHVSGGIYTENTLQVGGTTIDPQIRFHVNGNASIEGDLHVRGTTSTFGRLKVNEVALLTNGLIVNGNGTMEENLTVGEKLTVRKDLIVQNDLSVADNTSMGRNLTVGEKLTVRKDLIVQNDLSVADNTSMGRNLTVGEKLTVRKDLIVQNDLSVTENVNIGAVLTVSNLVVKENLHILTGNAFKPGGGAWTPRSDIRLKKNVSSIENALDKLLRLRGVRFEWKEPEQQGNLTGEQLGLISQEVLEVFPEWVDTDSDGYQMLSIRGFEALAIESFRELYDRINQLKKKIEEFTA